MSRGSLTAIVAILLAVAASGPALALGDVLPRGGFRLERVLLGQERVSGIAISGDEIFFCERTTGNVRVLRGGILQATPFLSVAVGGGTDEGLLDVTLHPDFVRNGWVYVFYTEAGTLANKVVRYTRTGNVGASPLVILTLPNSNSGTRIGGSMTFGADRKLYVATGDFGGSGDAQDESRMVGKILRLNDDGSVPTDNPVAGSLVYAKGFRHATGLALNRSVGTLYQTDRGTTGVDEECNAIVTGNSSIANFAWDFGSGKLGNPAYVDPLTEHASVVTTSAVVPYTGTHFPEAFRNDVYYACTATGRIEQVDVAGPKLDTFVSTQTFYNPANDGDGTVDPNCPKKWADAAISDDGYLYLSLDGGTTNDGLYRVIYDDSKGPREVSAPGSTHPLLVERISDTAVRLTFEDQLKDADVRNPLAPGQHNSKYTFWKGTLPIDDDADGVPDWSHIATAAGNGTGVNQLTLSQEIATTAGASEYFLVSSLNANFEGTLGRGTTGIERPGYNDPDWCNSIGWNPFNNGQCAPDFKTKSGAPLQLWDEFGQLHSLAEYRTGQLLHLDLGASDCYWCHVQADDADMIEDKFRARGFKSVLVLEKNLSGATPYTDPASCAAGIAEWRAEEGGDYTILCDRDMDGNKIGDVWEQYNRTSCNGFPQNYYIDRNNTIWSHVCGYDDAAEGRINNKAWAQWCE